MNVSDFIDDIMKTPAEAASEPPARGEALLGFVFLVAIVVLLAAR